MVLNFQNTLAMDGIDSMGFQAGVPTMPGGLSMVAGGPMIDSSTAKAPTQGRAGAPKKGPKSVKKPPNAPKRFKSSFIFFSMAKHKQIKEQLNTQGESAVKTTNITKMVSDAWRNMGAEERELFDQMAREDKARYEREKASYQGPTGASGSRKQKDPNAPKRPMSAYLAFANSRRAEVKAQNQECSNGEISKILSHMWKEAPEDIKKKYREEEASLWETYKSGIVEWRKKNDGRKKAGKAETKPAPKKKRKKKAKAADDDSVPFGGEFEMQQLQSGHGAAAFGNFGGMDSVGNPNEDEMMAASALRGVRGGGSNFGLGGNGGNNLGNSASSAGGNQALLSGGNQALLQQHQQSQAGNGGGGGLGSFFGGMNGMNGMGGMNPYAGVGGGNGGGNGFPSDMANNPANARALLDLGYNPLQQFGGMMSHGLGNSQAMLMAQALRGSTGSYHNQLLGLVDQQPSLSQLASLAGSQSGGVNGGGGNMSSNGMGGMGLLNDNSNGSMNRMSNSMGGNPMGGSDRF